MGNSLHDQLIKAGLVSEKQAKNAYKTKQKNKKLARKGQASAVEPKQNTAAQKESERKIRDRKLNKQRQEKAEQKSKAAQIRQLIDNNQVSVKDGDISYNFTDNNKIKRIYVNREVQSKLTSGAITIVNTKKGYALVPTEIAEKIRQRDPSRILAGNDPATEEKDDAYSEYKIPDDLMW
ncbi:MAG: DUF2058 domain-containing protein [Gammaproteobacteria bacterium]|nr:DUF2058 domain-containing protein [Gammaproteobacteria bacterium]